MREPSLISTSQPSSLSPLRGGGGTLKPALLYTPPKPTAPSRKRSEAAHANMLLRGVSDKKIRALDAIVELAGKRPDGWNKPRYGDFDYWLARNCGWIGDDELKTDYNNYQALRQKARNSALKYRWEEGQRYDAPKETDEFIPEVNMRLIKDRNLTDSARRIALFVMRHIYQDNRQGRQLAMTVSFIMKGLSLSRRTVQRNLSLLQKLGYVQSDVIPSSKTRMCIGLMISILPALLPKHHKTQWPQKRRKPDAPRLTHNHYPLLKTNKKCDPIDRRSWFLRCSNGIIRSILQKNHRLTL